MARASENLTYFGRNPVEIRSDSESDSDPTGLRPKFSLILVAIAVPLSVVILPNFSRNPTCADPLGFTDPLAYSFTADDEEFQRNPSLMSLLKCFSRTGT